VIERDISISQKFKENMNSPIKYINRQDFLEQISLMCKSDKLSFDGSNIVISCPYSAKNKFHSYSYEDIQSHIEPILKTFSIEQDFYLQIRSCIKEKVTYIPLVKEEGMPRKFPLSEKVTSLNENYIINANHIYDEFLLNVKSIPTAKIYRIETRLSNKGFYESGLFDCYVNEQLHPFPRNEPKFHNMFIDDCPHPKYSEKWFFGFSNLDEAKQWINGSLTEDTLGVYKELEKSAVLKELLVPEPFVIHGNKQLIFQKNNVVYEKEIDFNLLNVCPDYSDVIDLEKPSKFKIR
jgi:hypothetical protein